MLGVLSPKGGSWYQAFPAWTAETGDENDESPPFVNIIIYIMLCFMKSQNRFAKTDVLYVHTDAHVVRVRPH